MRLKFWFNDGIFICLFLKEDFEYILLLLIIFSIVFIIGELYPVLLLLILEFVLFILNEDVAVFSFEIFSLNLSNWISGISFSSSSILSSILVK